MGKKFPTLSNLARRIVGITIKLPRMSGNPLHRILSLLLFILFSLPLASCDTPERLHYYEIREGNYPKDGTYGVSRVADLSRVRTINCLVRMEALYADQIYVSKFYFVPFNTSGYYSEKTNWLEEFLELKRRFVSDVSSSVDGKLRRALGISEKLWVDSFAYNASTLFEDVGNVESPDPFSDNITCPTDWTLRYQISLADSTNTVTDALWRVGISIPNESSTSYFKISSGANYVEFPLRDYEVEALLFREYEASQVLKEIVFEDPALTIGESNYEESVLQNAIRVQKDGELVARFSWSSIESQETVLDLASRLTLFKAWISGKHVHHPAFIGYMRDRFVSITDVSVHTVGSDGDFILGFGSLGSGSSSVDFSQLVISEPVVQGDLYLLSE